VVVMVVLDVVSVESAVTGVAGTMMGWQPAVKTIRDVQTDKNNLCLNMLHLWGKLRIN
jgi:hypothetical protein